MCGLIPAVLAYQRYKRTRAKIFLYCARGGPRDPDEHLLALVVAYGDDELAAEAELIDQRFGDDGPAGGDEDRVIWLVCVPSVGAVASLEVHIAKPEAA